MNIFFTSYCPVESAKALDDKRRNKLILESAQMLSTTLRHYGYEGKDVYKKAFYNHPSTKWVRESRENFLWLVKHMEALCDLCESTYNKRHKSAKLLSVFKAEAKRIPSKGLTPFANCAANSEKGISYKHIKDPVKAYQLYLNHRWETDKRPPTWDGVKK